MPVHHKPSGSAFEPSREPIARFETTLRDTKAYRSSDEIGETFVLPL